MLIELNNITHFFGELLIFKNVSLELFPGKIYMLRGANGSGKSTLLKIIAGILKPTEGKVISSIPKYQIGYLAHQPFLYSYLTAEENLDFFATIYGLKLSKQVLFTYLEEVGLKFFAREKVKNFSRGMKQRLNLARLFLCKPEVILLDEPETGLDKEFQAKLREKITFFKKEGKLVIWISHLDNFSAYDFELSIENKELKIKEH